MKRKIGDSIIGDVLRKVPLRGVDGLGLPSDLRRVIVQNIESLRESATDIFAQEVSKVLSRMDLQRMADEIFKNYTLRVEAKIELQPKTKKSGKGSKR